MAWAAHELNNAVYLPLKTCQVRFGERVFIRQAGSFRGEEVALERRPGAGVCAEKVAAVAEAVRALLEAGTSGRIGTCKCRPPADATGWPGGNRCKPLGRKEAIVLTARIGHRSGRLREQPPKFFFPVAVGIVAFVKDLETEGMVGELSVKSPSMCPSISCAWARAARTA